MEEVLPLPSHRAGEKANSRDEAPTGSGGECLGADWVVLVWVCIKGIDTLDCANYWEYVLCNGNATGVFRGVYVLGRCVPRVRGKCVGGEFADEELLCSGVPVIWREAVSDGGNGVGRGDFGVYCGGVGTVSVSFCRHFCFIWTEVADFNLQISVLYIW